MCLRYFFGYSWAFIEFFFRFCSFVPLEVAANHSKFMLVTSAYEYAYICVYARSRGFKRVNMQICTNCYVSSHLIVFLSGKYLVWIKIVCVWTMVEIIIFNKQKSNIRNKWTINNRNRFFLCCADVFFTKQQIRDSDIK